LNNELLPTDALLVIFQDFVSGIRREVPRVCRVLINRHPNLRRLTNAGATLASSISALGGASLRLGEATISTAASAYHMTVAVGALAVEVGSVVVNQTVALGTAAHTAVSRLGRRRRYYSEFCLICREDPATIMVLPCNHVCMCAGCLERLRAHQEQAPPQRRAQKCVACKGPVCSWEMGRGVVSVLGEEEQPRPRRRRRS